MKGKKDHKQATLGPVKRKTFQAVLAKELRDQVPPLGALTAAALAKHLEKIVHDYFPPTERLRMGQVLWPAVDVKETPGYQKSIENCKLKPVFLSVFSLQGLEAYLAGTRKKKIRMQITARLFREAFDQGGVLTGADVGSLLGLTPSTIYRYIREYEKEHVVELPHRGRIHDIGPTITHKRQICHMVVVQGKTIEDTARDSNHSPQAVTRYVQDYRRVHQCLKHGFSLEETSYATKLSKKVVQQYADLRQEYQAYHSGFHRAEPLE